VSEELAGLYLHVPFCARVCPYCDFAVRTGDAARRKRYVDHLLAEIELYADSPLCFDTIYFGGGTPSSLEPEDLARIVDTLRARLRFADETRTFIEVNPEDVSPGTTAAWKQLGVDTISLGIQSLDRDRLSFLGRQHGPDDVRGSIETARSTGFQTVSIDLIYGMPDQTPADWRVELDRALELEPDHISCYQLTIHQRTRFGLLEKRGKLTQLPSDEQADLFELTHRHLNGAGLQGYEVSQFAVSPEHHSRHNIKYWNHTPYLGLGPSAHSFDGRRRWWNIRRTDSWQSRIREERRPVESFETLDKQALVLESLMMGFRTYAGVDLARVSSRWGVDLVAANRPLIERLQTQGLLRLDRDRLVPTLGGLAVADSLASQFVL
jgi:oxygen-independent coproporphyrinogen-3 oxidase